ncbi:TPA: hypothetical protein N0F65_002407 [Lagenidium giganteum]|uniref:Calcineurin-like phosphoesterase n=1 Tax=Lagenidium giganteum TaxID=4803 RepID=A0AAV2YN85_9STRA|nr:TPA: hypothetical protein N0F65_002407 [Lagenidium giganteum]
MSSWCSRVATVAVGLLAATASAATRKPNATIDIISYNDVYELLQDDVNGFKVGGPSRVIPIVRELRATTGNSLVLFAGDTMSPSLWSFQFKGMQMVEAHNAIGVDYACLGNHEFDFGIDAFLNVSQASNFPWLNANCYENSTNALLRGTVPNAVKEMDCPEAGKIKIGLFGIMYDMKLGKDLYWSDPIAAAKEQVKHLREVEKVDYVIALTHQTMSDDNRLSKEVKGIDVIYGGHEHTTMMQTQFGTPYLKSEFDFRTLWASHIEYFAPAGEKQPAVSRMTHRVIPVTEEMESDAEFDQVIEKYKQEIAVIHNRTVGSLCAPLDLTSRSVRGGDCAVGSIFADASLVFYGEDKADAALINGGLIRSDTVYPAGPFTLGQLISWSPFGNTIVITETDGASTKKLITSQMDASCGGGFIELNGFYMHPAGLKYQFKCQGTGKGEITSIEWFKHPTKTGPLKDDEVVRLAMTNYVYTTQFELLKDIKTKMLVSEAEASRIDTALEEYLKSQKDETFCQEAEGRSEVVV